MVRALGFLSVVALAALSWPQDTSTAHVNLYTAEDELRVRAEKLAADGKYFDALKIYQRAMAEPGNPLVRVDRERFLGVRQFCLDRIASWGVQGRAAYQSVYDPDAAVLFDRAKRNRDKELLATIERLYPFSSYVPQARLLLANFCLEEGEDARAAEVLDRSTEPLGLAQLGLALARLGEIDRLRRLIARVRDEFAAATILENDRRISVLEFLDARLRECRPREARVPEFVDLSWPMYGGDARGTRIDPVDVLASVRAWSALLPVTEFSYSDRGMVYEDENGTLSPRNENTNPIVPSAADGIVYVHNEFTVHAFSLFADAPEPVWTFRTPEPPGDLMFEERTLHTTLVHAGRVYVNLVTEILGSETRLGYLAVKYPFPKRALFCLDAYTGRVLWRLGGEKGKLERNELPDRVLTFAMTPVPCGDRLYVGAIVQQSAQDLFQHYVLCLDRDTGKILWRTPVASGGTEINLFGNPIRESQGSRVSILGDDLFYCTNLGAAACIDRNTGDVKWVTQYRPLPLKPTRQFPPSRNPYTWDNNPVIATREVVILTPCDSAFLYALDPKSGRVLYTIEQKAHDARAIYGISGDTLVLGGQDVRLLELKTGRLVATLGSRRGARGAGRGTVSERRVYFPTIAGLSILDLAKREEIDFHPWNAKGGANVVVSDKALIVTIGQRQLEVYFDPSNERDLEPKSSSDPNASYRSALGYLQARNIDGACRCFERVVELTRAVATSEGLRLRMSAQRHLYMIYLRRALKSTEKRDWPDAERAYALAAAATTAAGERVEIMFKRADLFRQQAQVGRLVETLQELVRTYPDVAFGEGRVFDLARAQIAEALRGDRAAYAEFDREADLLWASASRRASADELASVYLKFPNSRAAPSALFAASEILVGANHSDAAWKWLRTLVRDFPGHETLPRAQELLVRVLEEKRLFASARKVLLRMRQESPTAKVSDQGSVEDFVRARLEREDYKKLNRQTASPALTPPLKPAFQYVDRDAMAEALIEPLGVPQGRAADVVVARFGSTLRLIRDGKLEAGFALPSALRQLIWYGETLLVCCDGHLVAIDLSARTLWKHAASTTLRAFQVADEFVCFLVDGAPARMSMVALNAATGEPAWRTENLVGSQPAMYGVEGDLVVHTHNPERLYMIAVENGAVKLSRTLVDQDRQSLLYVSAGVAVFHSAVGPYVDVYELPTGRFRWRRELTSREAVAAANEKWVTIAGPGRLEMISLASGKLTFVKEGAVENVAQVVVEEDTAYVLDADKLVAFRGGEIAWHVALGRAVNSERSIRITRDHLVVFTDELNDNAKFQYGFRIIDRGGKSVQVHTSEPRFEKPSSLSLMNGRIVASADATLEVYR